MYSAEKSSFYSQAFRRLLADEGSPDIFPQHMFEQYPHILDKIFLLWTEPALASKYFNELLTTNRESRAGFPPDVYSELLALEKHMRERHPTMGQVLDSWGGVNKRG